MTAKYFSILLALGTVLPLQAWSQRSNPLQQQDKDAWRRQEEPQEVLTVTPRMKNTISAPSLLNITEAEQAFCSGCGERRAVSKLLFQIRCCEAQHNAVKR